MRKPKLLPLSETDKLKVLLRAWTDGDFDNPVVHRMLGVKDEIDFQNLAFMTGEEGWCLIMAQEYYDEEQASGRITESEGRDAAAV